MLSKACEYGIRATIYVARQSQDGKRSNLKEISAAIRSPEAFTAKILQQLVRSNVLFSAKGISGGFGMDPGLIPVTPVSKIVKAIDGEALFHHCVLGLEKCSEKNPCPMHTRYHGLRKEISGMMESALVGDLVNNLEMTVLKT